MTTKCPGCEVSIMEWMDICSKCQRAVDWFTYFLVWAGGTLTEDQIHKRIRRLRRMNQIAGDIFFQVQDECQRRGVTDPEAIPAITNEFLQKNAEFCELLKQEADASVPKVSG